MHFDIYHLKTFCQATTYSRGSISYQWKFLLFFSDIAEFSESDDETLDSANTSNTSKDTDSSGHGSPDIRSRLPVSEEDEVVFRNRGSGCSSFTTGSLYSCVPTEFSDSKNQS